MSYKVRRLLIMKSKIIILPNSAADKDQTDSLNALKTELDQIRKDISKKSDQISSMKDSKKKMNGSLDTLKVDFGDRLAKLEMQYTTQQTGMEFVLSRFFLKNKSRWQTH